MFKSEISFTNSHQLSKKERKDICNNLLIKYDKDYVEYINLNFKNMSIQKGNIQNHKRNVVLYENNPILFEYDIKYYIPTVYLLQYFNFGPGNNLFKNVCRIYDETVSYLLNGADLMLKGVLNREKIKKSEKNFTLGELYYIQTVSGSIVGLGVTTVSRETMNIDNPTGKFLKIIHRIGDSLWNIGNKKVLEPLPIPQKNVEEKRDKNLEDEQNAPTENGKKDGDNNFLENNEEIINTDKKIEVQAQDELKSEIVAINEPQHEDLKEEDIKEDNKNNENESEENEEEDKKEELSEAIPSQEEIDEHFDIVFLTLCKLHLQQEKFPMDPGKLYQQFMKPLSEELHLYIDIKLSSYKKINNYFKHLHKDKSLLTFSKAKGQNNDYIQSINWNNEELKNFKPRVKKLKFLSHEDAPKEHDNILLSKDEKIEVQILYRPNQKINVLFPKYLPSFTEKSYYPLKPCTEVLTSYLKDNNLFILDQPGMVKLDSTLEKVLSIHYDKFSLEERLYKIDDVLEMWKSNLNQKSCIMRTNSEQSQEIFTNNLQIRIIAKKMNNKNVTLVSGLDKFIDINQATKSLAKYFATSVTIKDEIMGLKNTIFIQGYWVTELVNKLVEEFKIKKTLIKVEDRLKSKIKKK